MAGYLVHFATSEGKWTGVVLGFGFIFSGLISSQKQEEMNHILLV